MAAPVEPPTAAGSPSVGLITQQHPGKSSQVGSSYSGEALITSGGVCVCVCVFPSPPTPQGGWGWGRTCETRALPLSRTALLSLETAALQHFFSNSGEFFFLLFYIDRRLNPELVKNYQTSSVNSWETVGDVRATRLGQPRRSASCFHSAPFQSL